MPSEITGKTVEEVHDVSGFLLSIPVRNPSVILSPTLARNEKVEHYIRIKTHKPIALRFWVESGVSALYGWAQVSLVYCIFPVKSPL